MNIDKNKLYEGYYWMSDSEKPIVLKKEKFPVDLEKPQNPFVIEAQLFDEESKTSFAVKLIDGNYYVKDFTLSQQEIDESQTFIPKSRLEGIKELKIVQKWELQKDDDELLLCEGMKALIPTALVFAGFNYLKTKEE